MKRASIRALVVCVGAAGILFSGLFGAVPASAQADNPTAPPRFRLPSDIVAPVRYALDLTIVPDQDTFTGAVDVKVNFKRATPVLWLNAERLQFKDASLATDGGTVAARILTEPHDYVGFQFDHAVGPGPATLHVSYQGEINRKDQQGIFQMKDGGQWYVYSQFEEIWARRAFPCFDEPEYKVPWQMTLHVKKDQIALSNTNILSETDTGDGMKTVKFAETPPLPSYLVALTVGNMDLVDAGTAGKKNTRIRIVVPKGHAVEATYAAKTSGAILTLLENYFGIPYPYDKLDEVAVPLSGLSMEHPGLITHSGYIILRKPEADTLGRQRQWVSVCAHEMAHQWFGDLVTTAWWDDIWLNEGFASWMANKIVNEYHPEWQMNIGELNGYQGAMDNDALVSARQVRQPIRSNDDIANAFDGITYNKGSALLNMFESYMGPERFRAGIQRYLKRYEWRNATSAEFLTALAGDDHEIAAAFSSFLDQPGVPLLSASLECHGSTAKVGLSQQRFLPLGSHGSGEELWKIPVCARYPAGRQCTLLQQAAGEIDLKTSSCPKWLDVNADADGYYRVLYPPQQLAALLKAESGLSLPEKVSLIGDVAALTQNGRIPLGQALELAPGLASDPARQVVTKTMEITTGLQYNLVETGLLPRYRQYLAGVYGARARELGWESKAGESDDNRLLRPSLENVMANDADDPEAIAEADKLALAWLSDHKAVQPDMINVVLSTAARHGDRSLFDQMRAAARQEKDENIRGTLLACLGEFPDPDITRSALPILLTNEFDSRESLNILFGATISPKTRDLAYDFVKQNWDAIIAKFPTDTGSFLPFVAGSYCDEQHRRDARDFFDGRSTKYTGGPRNLAQMLEEINLCIAYKRVQEPSVTKFLQNYAAKPPSSDAVAGSE
ncbi:MAG TPA: M1 family metallopeptidase [Terriglobia bacterium]|nr:M1 family metallopeptidase [Terriglobia bacterium]